MSGGALGARGSGGRRRSRRVPTILLSVLLAVGPAALLPGCGDAPPTRDLRVTIVDPNGQPIVGAVFYAEARDESGAFACVVDLSGEAGEVPHSAWTAGKLGWRPGAKAAMAAFAEGRRPAVHWDDDAPVRTDGAVLILEPAAYSSEAWNPALANFAWPIPADGAPAPGDPAQEALRAALARAWEARAALPPPLNPAEQARLDAISGEKRPK